MIIELVFPGCKTGPGPDALPGLYSVRNYNDDCVIHTTPSLLEAAHLASCEAVDFERGAIIRVHAGEFDRRAIVLTTDPRALVAVVILVAVALRLVSAFQRAADIIASARSLFPTGEYQGASYRVLLGDGQPSDSLTMTCASCNFTQPLEDFNSPGRCTGCGKPTCDVCNDRGRCRDCSPAGAVLAGTASAS